MGATLIRLLLRASKTANKFSKISIIPQTTKRSQSTIISSVVQQSSPLSAPNFSSKSSNRLLAGIFFLTLGGGLTYSIITNQVSIQFNRPSDASSVALEAELQAHPLVSELRKNPSLVESRPHLRIPGPLRTNSFVAGDMIAPNKLPVPPLVFSSRDGSEYVSIMYLGRALCGHPGIVHGGLLATLMDESLARTCFPALPNNIGLTATLTVDFKAACKSEQWVVMKGKTTRQEGRKAWVEGVIGGLNEDGTVGKVFVEGKALFVEPKNAKIAGALMKIIT